MNSIRRFLAVLRPVSLVTALSITITCCLAPALISPPVAYAQEAQVSGLVTDSSGAIIAKATITILNKDKGITRTTQTNESGYYAIPLLPPGNYLVTVQCTGFQTVSRDNVVLSVGQEARFDFKMKVGDVKETVTVEGAAPLLNTETPVVSTLVDRNFIENMPMNGRSFQTLIELTPGVVMTPVAAAGDMGQFSVNGQRVDSNYMTVDGVSANFGASTFYYIGNSSGGAVPATNVNGGFSGLVSIDAMQEFRIQTSTYAPEFGRQPGGQISIVSRSGTNQFHGTVFDYFRNTVLNANDWFADSEALPKAAMRQNDFGGVVGGPIIKDKTFFFASYEGLRLALPQTGITYVPSQLARSLATPALAPYMDMWPQPNGGLVNGDPYTSYFNATYSNTTTLNAGSIRLDQAIGKGLTLFGRYNYAPSSTTLRRGENLGALNNIETDTQNITTITLGLTWMMSQTATNEFRINYSRDYANGFTSIDNFGNATVPPDSYLVPYGSNNLQNGGSFATCLLLACGTEIGGTFYQIGRGVKNISQQYNMTDNQSIIKGTHTIKFGVDVRRSPLHSFPFSYIDEPFFTDFGPDPGGALSGQTLEWQTLQARDATITSTDFATYVQDTWRATKRLTATYGLRYDLELPFSLSNGLHFPVASALYPVQNFTAAPVDAPPFGTNYKNFAPRVGLAYQLRQTPGRETVLRGGFGTFYDLMDQDTGFMLYAWGGYPIGSSNFAIGGPYPFTPAQYTPLPIVWNPAACCAVYDPNIKQPHTYEWNFSIQQSLGSNQTITATYVGAAGRNLVIRDYIVGANPTFSFVDAITSGAISNYDALQLQFQRRLSRGLQALVSYSWAKSLDEGSTAGANDSDSFGTTRAGNYGPSNFDIRHNFSAAVTYEPPKFSGNAVAAVVLNHWAVDNIFLAHSAPPVDVGVGFASFGNFYSFQRPNVVSGQPLYLYGSQYPGGKVINENAFSFPTDGSQGDLGRNALRSFGAWQWDMALRREFFITEGLHLQFRAEGFNLFNHPNFGPLVTTLYAAPSTPAQYGPAWGQAQQMLNQALGGGSGAVNPLYQIGGPRSFQLALKFVF
jgi:hypothetical protein